MAIEPIKGFYVHDEETDTDGVAKVDYGAVENTPDFEALKNVEPTDLLYNVEWEPGSFNDVTGEPSNDDRRIRTNNIDVSNTTNIYVSVASGYEWAMYAFTDTNTVANDQYYSYTAVGSISADGAGTRNWHTADENVLVKPDIKYVRFLLKVDDTTIMQPAWGVNLSAKADYGLLYDLEKLANGQNDLNTIALRGNYTIFEKYWYQAVPRPIYEAHPDYIGVSKTRICSNYIEFPTLAKSVKITPATGLNCAYYIYDENGHKVTENFWAGTFYKFDIESNYKYMIVALAKQAGGNITPSEHGVTITCEPVLTLSEFTQPVFNITELSTVDLDWKIGTLAPNYGYEDSSTTRLRSRYILVGKGTTLKVSSPYMHLIYTYDLEQSYVNDIAWTGDDIVVENDCYIRVLVRKFDNGTISENEIATVAAQETIYRTFPQYLMDREIYTPPVEIPEYFESAIDTAIETAKDNIFAAGISGDSFVFISDVHWQNNARHSPALVNKAVENLNLDKIICGGDLIGGGAKATNIDLMADCVNQFKEITRFYCLFGNHDNNTIGAPSTDDYFTKSESYALMQKQSDFVMDYGEPCYFYFDNPTTKTRYICLDTGLEGSSLGAGQRDWIASTLNSTPENWHILVFAHIIYMPTNGYHIGITKDELYRTSFMNTVCTMLDTFNTDNDNEKVEAIFGGHMHFDADFTTDGGIPIVLIDCDTRQTFTETEIGSGVANHALGTVNEQCFDIVTVDYANSTIKCVRVGRGSDRTFTY